ncbi:YodC family protein [Piscirickettsia salmonis]|uniref:YodC family protein n=1 Tax=Piscirickettsia salmonis TaxID=1238 RepID=UPI0007C89D1C|nr:hypothetical protein A0O36_00855 [Piscirickettsiaceae bacterium NZ-RLO1]
MKQEHELDVGDVVTLKSGGPPMTVRVCSQSSYTDDIEYSCYWFNQVDGNGNFSLQQGIFSGLTLKKLDQDDCE